MSEVKINREAVPEELMEKLHDALFAAVPDMVVNVYMGEDPSCPEFDLTVDATTIDEGLLIFQAFYDTLANK
jgi:hypothetical protein